MAENNDPDSTAGKLGGRKSGDRDPLASLETELRNQYSAAIDEMSSAEIVHLINAEDAQIAPAVALELDAIAAAVDVIAARMRRGGRLVYVGAGTSGRLGVLDASECPPTFSTPPELVVGLIAGGFNALTRAIEGAEDHPQDGARDLEAIQLRSQDVVVGIATSGRTPYVIGALKYAKQLGAYRIALSCVRAPRLAEFCELSIAPLVGPEIVTGSTRMKAGTATKMVLNMLTTATMIRLGKTFGNLMVDLTATNSKLQERTKRIVAELADLSPQQASELLQRCDGELKTAIVAQLRGVAPPAARRLLEDAGGHLRRAIQEADLS